MLVSAALGTPGTANAATAVSTTTTTSTVMVAHSASVTQTVAQFARTYFADIPIMVDIARCESRFRQFDADGNVLRGKVNTGDIGLMQINEGYHAETAEKLGIDINTIEGNAAYARWLYDREGTDPWVSSSKCWGKNKNNAAPTVATHMATSTPGVTMDSQPLALNR